VYQLKLLILNTDAFLTVLQGFSWIAIVLLLACILFVRRGEVADQRFRAVLLISTITLFLLYGPILIDARYFWLLAVCLLFAGGSFLAQLLTHERSRSFTAGLLFCYWLSWSAAPLFALLLQYDDGKVFTEQAHALAAVLPMEGKHIAANVWKPGLYVSYHVRGAYYGTPKKSDDVKQIEAQLLAAKIDYYLDWGSPLVGFKKYTEAPQTVIAGLHIYRLR
jgi:hypothetical protein